MKVAALSMAADGGEDDGEDRHGALAEESKPSASVFLRPREVADRDHAQEIQDDDGPVDSSRRGGWGRRRRGEKGRRFTRGSYTKWGIVQAPPELPGSVSDGPHNPSLTLGGSGRASQSPNPRVLGRVVGEAFGNEAGRPAVGVRQKPIGVRSGCACGGRTYREKQRVETKVGGIDRVGPNTSPRSTARVSRSIAWFLGAGASFGHEEEVDGRPLTPRDEEFLRGIVMGRERLSWPRSSEDDGHR